MGGKAEVNSVAIRIHEEWPHTQGRLERGEIRKIGKLKMGKFPGLDGITAEMLKHGGKIVVYWMV